MSPSCFISLTTLSTLRPFNCTLFARPGVTSHISLIYIFVVDNDVEEFSDVFWPCDISFVPVFCLFKSLPVFNWVVFFY